jgi:2-polyprenyl-3-methyl-5-hydroxy-6-metoxy-1,4-benzoquinol methylase
MAMEDPSTSITRRLTEAYGVLKNAKRTMAMENSSSGIIGRLTEAYGVLRTLRNKEAMEDNSLDIFGRLLDVVPSGRAIVDSACSHGRYAIMARDTGRFSRVVAFDARSDRIPFHEAGIEWRISKIEDWDYSGFDVVLLSGILYHLDPVRQTRVMRRVHRQAVVRHCQHAPCPM